jgi:hypothetical protein
MWITPLCGLPTIARALLLSLCWEKKQERDSDSMSAPTEKKKSKGAANELVGRRLGATLRKKRRHSIKGEKLASSLKRRANASKD